MAIVAAYRYDKFKKIIFPSIYPVIPVVPVLYSLF